jgi:hypothetical protein
MAAQSCPLWDAATAYALMPDSRTPLACHRLKPYFRRLRGRHRPRFRRRYEMPPRRHLLGHAPTPCWTWHSSKSWPSLHYAQVCMAHDAADWSAVAEFLELIGPRIKELSDRRAIGAATMDFHLPFWDNKVAISSRLPARVASLAGQNLIDIETSVYLTSSAT